MYKRYFLYGIVIFCFYKLFQHPMARVIYDNFSDEIQLLTFILIIFLSVYFFFRLWYRKYLIEPLSKTPVEFDVEKGYSVIEMGWLYHSSTQSVITAGIIELWKYNYIKIEEVRSEFYITLLKFPSKKEYELLIRLIFDTENLYINSICKTQKVLDKYKAEKLWAFNRQKTLFLKQQELRKGSEVTKSKDFNFIGIILLGFLFIKIVVSINVILFPFSLVIVFLGLHQIYKILYHGILTEKGKKVYDHLISYREYLKVLGPERFRTKNLIETDPHTFNDLPYLILFKMENRWTKPFSYLWGGDLSLTLIGSLLYQIKKY